MLNKFNFWSKKADQREQVEDDESNTVYENEFFTIEKDGTLIANKANKEGGVLEISSIDLDGYNDFIKKLVISDGIKTFAMKKGFSVSCAGSVPVVMELPMFESIQLPKSLENLDLNECNTYKLHEIVVDFNNRNYKMINGVLYREGNIDEFPFIPSWKNKNGMDLVQVSKAISTWNVPRDVKGLAFDCNELNKRYFARRQSWKWNNITRVCSDALTPFYFYDSDRGSNSIHTRILLPATWEVDFGTFKLDIHQNELVDAFYSKGLKVLSLEEKDGQDLLRVSSCTQDESGTEVYTTTFPITSDHLNIKTTTLFAWADYAYHNKQSALPSAAEMRNVSLGDMSEFYSNSAQPNPKKETRFEY